MAELQPIIVFHGRHFVRYLGICNPICVKFLQVMSGVIPRNLKKRRRLYLKPFSWGPQPRHTHTHTYTHTHTHTHGDSNRLNAMRCISPKHVCVWNVVSTLNVIGCVRGELAVPRAKKATLRRRSLTYTDTSLWNAWKSRLLPFIQVSLKMNLKLQHVMLHWLMELLRHHFSALGGPGPPNAFLVTPSCSRCVATSSTFLSDWKMTTVAWAGRSNSACH